MTYQMIKPTRIIMHNNVSILRAKIFVPASIVFLIFLMLISGCTGSRNYTDNTLPETIVYLSDTTGMPVEIHFQRGRYHNYPLMVFWLEDEKGNYIRTLYVARSIGKGVFTFGSSSEGVWKPGEIQRPASLPYWAHKRGVKNDFGNMIPSPKMPVTDAITGPTPKRNFVLYSNTGSPLPDNFVVKMEINQTWDFNEYWTNNKFPGNDEYMTSCQPALVYEARINKKSPEKEYLMTPIGHSHYDGSNGSLTTDLSTITTALDIARQVRIVFP